MPKAKMVRCSPETLELLKEYKEEFGMANLDSAIRNAVQWAKLWYLVDARTRRDMQKRISDLEHFTKELHEVINLYAGTVSRFIEKVEALEKAISKD